MKPNPIKWQVYKFDQLTISELYEMLRLRAEVFVVEQNCPYQDVDGIDQQCFHVLGWADDGRLAAYARILPVGIDAYESNCDKFFRHGGIGRVVVSPTFRGIGHELMDKTLEAYEKVIGKDIPCIIHAQAHLKRFYESHGFRQTSEICLIDNIEHIEMTKE